MTTLADLGVPTYSYVELLHRHGMDDWVSTGMTLVILFATVVLLETAVLSRASKQPSLLSLWDSLIVNGLSTAAGACLVAVGVVVRGEASAPQFVATFVGTLLLETPVLVLLLSSRMSVARTLRASVEMNAASYLLIALLVFTDLMK